MNRKARRAARAASKRHPAIDLVIRVHEAGHAVGRYLIAEQLGYKIEEAISRIDLYLPLSGPTVTVRSEELRSGGCTYGPRLSRELQEFIKSSEICVRSLESLGHIELQKPEFVSLITAARGAGIDIASWIHARSFSSVLGPMAEARLSEKPFMSVWLSPESSGDLEELMQEFNNCSMTPEQVSSILNTVIAEAQAAVNHPDVWRAIITLADQLKSGRMPGRKAVEIIKEALAADRRFGPKQTDSPPPLATAA